MVRLLAIIAHLITNWTVLQTITMKIVTAVTLMLMFLLAFVLLFFFETLEGCRDLALDGPTRSSPQASATAVWGSPDPAADQLTSLVPVKPNNNTWSQIHRLASLTSLVPLYSIINQTFQDSTLPYLDLFNFISYGKSLNLIIFGKLIPRLARRWVQLALWQQWKQMPIH